MLRVLEEDQVVMTFMEKMSIMCTQLEFQCHFISNNSRKRWTSSRCSRDIPNFKTVSTFKFNFYVDGDHLILEILESWMTYINPLSDKKRLSEHGRLNYPENYKERLHVSKFERDTFLRGSDFGGNPRATKVYV